MDPINKFCKKDATPNPFGGYYDTYLGLSGTKFKTDTDTIVVVVDDTIDPNKIVENNVGVVFIMIGTILLLTLIVLIGLVSLN